MSRDGGQRRPSGRWVGVAGLVATAVLAAFHVRLLWQRVADGSLVEPGVALRWAASALVTLALLRLWSRGLPLVRGRRAATLWLVVLLLHAGGPAGSLPAAEPVTSLVLLSAALAVALLGRGARSTARDRQGDARFAARRRRRAGRRPRGWSSALFSRPPPATLHP